MSGHGRVLGAVAAIVVAMIAGAGPTSGGIANGHAVHGTTRAELVYSCTGDICTIGADGKGLRQLTSAKWINDYPTWSPDGRRIAYTGLLLYRAIFVVNTDGSRGH